MLNNTISSFSGDYDFLSNFYILSEPMTYEGIEYNSSENAYQAAKFQPIPVKKHISTLSPGQSKRFGRKEPGLRKDWEEVKVNIMREILILKFSNQELFDKLYNTGDVFLIEGNTWHDNFWGCCPPNNTEGKNMLGKLLMEVRSLLRGD